MSRNYDNWEKLVGAVLRRENDRQLAYCESFSTCYSGDLSSRFSFDSAVEDADNFRFNPFVGDVHLPAGNSIDEQMDESRSSNWDVGFQPFNDTMPAAGIKAKNGFDALHIAAKQGDLEVVKVLMEAHPELSMTVDIANTTALHTAATQGRIEVVNYFLESESSLATVGKYAQ